MKGELALRKPVGTAAALNSGSTNITAAAFFELQAATAKACSAVCLTNQGAQPILVATGAAGSEVLTGLVIPPADAIIVPIEIAAGVRVSLKSLGATQSSGYVTISYFQ